MAGGVGVVGAGVVGAEGAGVDGVVEVEVDVDTDVDVDSEVVTELELEPPETTLEPIDTSERLLALPVSGPGVLPETGVGGP